MMYRYFVFPIVISAVYILTEWGFLWTQPASFLGNIDLKEQLNFLNKTFAFLNFNLFIIIIIGLLLEKIIARYIPKVLKVSLPLLPSSTLLAITTIIMIDNFTHTLMGFAITTATWNRIFYVILFFALWVFGHRILNRVVPPKKSISYSLITLTLLSIITSYNGSNWDILKNHLVTIKNKPNIIFFGIDGVPADYLSTYGFDRKTSPTLDAFAGDQSLILENFYTNCAHTLGSTMSLITGKHPLQTKVVHPPGDYFKGKDVYNHFLSVLRNNGYELVQIGSIGVMADQAHLMDSFHIINGRSIVLHQWPFYKYFFDYSSEVLFSKMYGRVEERGFHLFGIRDYVFSELVEDALEKSKQIHRDDNKRIQFALEYIQKVTTPFLLHIHLGSTHGKTPLPREAFYSKGMALSEKNWEPFFWDTIREADLQFKEVIDLLKAKNIYENTIIVFYSDHGHLWKTDVRLPLVMRFPSGQFKGKRAHLLQNIDIVPTIIDYLKIPQPGDLLGQSFLQGEVDPDREIYSITYIPSGKPGYYYVGANMIKGTKSFYYDGKKRVFSITDLSSAHQKNNPIDEKKSQKKLLSIFHDWGYPLDQAVIWDRRFQDLMIQSKKYRKKLKILEEEKKTKKS